MKVAVLVSLISKAKPQEKATYNYLLTEVYSCQMCTHLKNTWFPVCYCCPSTRYCCHHVACNKSKTIFFIIIIISLLLLLV